METIEAGVDLYERGMRTLVAAWAEHARGATNAAVLNFPGVAVAVFPDGREREFYNNAVLDRGLAAGASDDAVDVLECVYAAASIERFAVWVHESDAVACRRLERRGYTIDTATRAMGLNLDQIRIPRPTIDLAPPDWASYVRIIGLTPDYQRDSDREAYHILIARSGIESVSTAMAFDFRGDCGIYNVGTLERYRRRGFGTALTAAHLYDALDRGCRTASLQSTPMAEKVYAAVGFQSLGRFLEYVPASVPDVT